jgi:hypothetical protein
VGESGQVLAHASLNDSWIDFLPQRKAQMPGYRHTQSGFGSLPERGTGYLEIDRVGDRLTIFWGGGEEDLAPFKTGRCSEPLAALRIRFCFSPKSGPGIRPHFGALWVDTLRLEGAAAHGR